MGGLRGSNFPAYRSFKHSHSAPAGVHSHTCRCPLSAIPSCSPGETNHSLFVLRLWRHKSLEGAACDFLHRVVDEFSSQLPSFSTLLFLKLMTMWVPVDLLGMGG